MNKLHERALAHHRRGDLDQAESLYRRILRNEPAHPDALHLLGCIELRRGRNERAIELMQQAIAIAPGTALYHENLAEAHHRSGQRELAAVECQLALRCEPGRAAALNRLGVIAMEEGEYDAAQEFLAQALRSRPAYAEALVNLGAVLTRIGDYDLALQSTDLALRLEPQNPLAWNNHGLALKGHGRWSEAKAAFLRAGALPMAQFNLGYIHLLEGDLAAGLPLCEARKRLTPPRHALAGAEWNGPATGRERLLVVHEQGMGDTILVSGLFAPLLARFRAVTVLVQEQLVRLVAGLDPGLRVTASLSGVEYDLWVSAMSLPFALGVRSPADLPTAPWIPRPARARAADRLRAGINWAGNPSFHFDRTRSTHLAVLEPLLAIPGIEWVSLHKGHREEEAERFGLPQPLRQASDFLDTAAVLAELDLVVSTETAVPNLSAAMGIPTCILAAVDHDWRWRTWYRDVRVCAQDAPGDWSSALVKAMRAVSEMTRAGARSPRTEERAA